MREASFIVAVHRKLDLAVHRQSMTGASMNTNGTPDRYYDCSDGERDLWVEYKFWPQVPQVQPVLVGDKQGQVSELQYAWLQRRWSCGENAYVIIGTMVNRKTLGAIVPACKLLSTDKLNFVQVTEVSNWINRFVLKGVS